MRVIATVCVVCLALGIAALVVLRKTAASPPAGAPAPAVAPAPAPAPTPAPSAGEPAVLRERKDFVGVVFAREAVDLAPKVEGTLETVAVRVGDRVERGASVATLDARSLERAVKMAEAAARASRAERVRAKVELQEAEGKLERREQLGEEHVAPEELATLQNETKLARARLEAASASVAEKRAHVDDLKATVKDTAIRTPIDGVVAARYQEPGAQVGPHAPIVRVINPATLWLRFAVTEDRAGTLAQAQPIEARVGQTGLVVKGVIRNIAPGVDPASRMIFVEAELELPEAARGSVSAGLVARVSLPGAP